MMHVSTRCKTLLTLALLGSFSACSNSNDTTAVRITVPRGASFRAAADSLAAHNVIGSPLFFRAYARIQGSDQLVQAGVYEMARNTGWDDLLRMLRTGEGIINRITIPEGFTLQQIGALLAQRLNVPPDSFEAAVRDSALRTQLHIPAQAPTVEGYLFPDTYVLAPGSSARQIVREMVQRFEQEWQRTDTTPLTLSASVPGALGLTRHQLLTMASVVEREARIADERPVIAGVYYNRLRIGMALQADPTVQYALGKHVERVMYKDLETDSPYNTYRYPGLPPGPIASPGAASIQAALHPADVPFLYFVARPNGQHEFRRTHDEHLKAIRDIQRDTVTPRNVTP